MGVNIGGVATLTSPGTTLAVDGASRWMDVNANGVLTRPQTPFMSGQLTGRGTSYNGGGGNMLVTADVNVGGCWNNATGYFTCPVAGYYMVTLGGIANTQAGQIGIRKNGVNIHDTHWNHTAAWHYVSFSAIVSCAASDTLHYVMFGLTPGSNGFYGDGGHGMYSIALMV